MNNIALSINKNTCSKLLLKLYNDLIKHDDIKKLNILFDLRDIDKSFFHIIFKQLIITNSYEVVVGISISYLSDIYGSCCQEPYIIKTELIGKDGKIIYDEDLGYVDVCQFSNMTELIIHLYIFADGALCL